MKKLLGGMTAVAVGLFAHYASASVVYSNDFEGGSTADFSAGTIVAAPNGSTSFLGSFGQGASTTLTLTGLAPYSSGTLSFTLDVIGSMDGDGCQGGTGIDPNGDTFNVNANSGQIFYNNFANYGGCNLQSYPAAIPTNGNAPGTGATSINGLGYSGYPDSGNGIQDSEYDFSDIAFSGDALGDLTITFTSDSNEGIDNEFYGIDNVVVTTNETPPPTGVPEPASLALLGSAIFGFGALRRRRTGLSKKK